MLLARAEPADLLSYNAWEVVVELGSRDDPQPVWKKNAWDEAVFVFTYPLMTGENGIVTWNPVLKRYFLPNYSFLQNNMSTPLAWHNKVYDEIANYHHRSQITIFESERPWGPWRLVWRDDDAQRTFGLIGPYTPTFPAKFVQKNGDMWLSISGNPGTPGYALNFAKVSFGGK